MIGGGVARAGEVLFDPLREHYKTYAFKSCRETPTWRPPLAMTPAFMVPSA